MQDRAWVKNHTHLCICMMCTLRPEFFYKLIYKLILFYPPTLNICFVENKFEVLSVFLRVTLLKVIVLSRFLGNDELFKDLIQTVGLPY